jgi:hypothetical protein
MVQAAPVHQAKAARQTAEEDVLGNRERGNQRQFLVNDADSEPAARARIGDLDRHAVHPDGAAILAENAREDVHQGGLAGAVLAHQGVDFSRPDIERHILQRLHRPKRLAHAGDFDTIGFSRHGQKSEFAR